MAAPATSSIRYWLMMAGSVAAGIALALAVVVGMIWLFKADPQQVVQANSGPTTPTVTNTGDLPDATPDSLAPVPAVNPAPADPADLETPVASPTEEPQPAAVAVPPKPAANPDDPPVAPEGDPLGLTKPIPTPAAPVNPKDPLAKFDALIGGDAEDPLAKPDETPEPPPTTAVDPGPEEETPAKPMLPRPPPREIDTVARLADPIPGIETSGTPLADFLRVISDLSTVPIVLETVGLPLVRVTPESPVVLKVSDTTVGGALTAALAPLGLEHVVADGHILVRVIEPAEMPTLSFPAKDLSAGDELQMTELAEALKTLVAPNAWNEADGSQITVNAAKGTLDIRQRRAVHASLLVAFEKLRTARKLPYATGTKYDSTMFALQSRSSKAKAKLDLPVSMTFAQPTNFVKILNHLEQAAGVRILVDWRDIAAAGWNADGEATLVVEKQPLAAALDALLVPMDLSWRVIDGRTLEIVTNSRLAEELELEFYKVAALTAEDPSGAALVARIRGALGESLFLDAGGQCELRSDEPGQCVLASLPQPKQRELEALLERWRTESAAE